MFIVSYGVEMKFEDKTVPDGVVLPTKDAFKKQEKKFCKLVSFTKSTYIYTGVDTNYVRI